MRHGSGTHAELFGQPAPLRHQDDAGGRGQQGDDRRRHQIGAQQEDRALGNGSGHLRRARLHPDQRLQRDLQVLRVGCGVLIEDDKVNRELFQPEKLTYFVALFHDKVFWRVIRTDSMKNADDVYRAFVAQTEKLAEVDIDALRLQAGNKYAEQMVTLNQQRLQNLQQDAVRQQQQSQQVAAQQQQAEQQAVSLSNDLRNTSSQLDAVKQQIRALEAQQNSTEIELPPPPETPETPAAPAAAAANQPVPAAAPTAPAPANSTH